MTFNQVNWDIFFSMLKSEWMLFPLYLNSSSLYYLFIYFTYLFIPCYFPLSSFSFSLLWFWSCEIIYLCMSCCMCFCSLLCFYVGQPHFVSESLFLLILRKCSSMLYILDLLSYSVTRFIQFVYLISFLMV